jgi:glycosyl-4,4'-diaponeurosporenoate acyltransferase
VLIVALANVAWWAAVHAGTGYLVHRLPAGALQRGGVLSWERRVYERVGIKRWKDRLPEAGALFRGGVSKRHVRRSTVERFVVETRRAELGHWLAMLGGPVSVLWNPLAGDIAMVAYGVLVNAPFVAVQRYNRARALRVIGRSMP